MIKCVVGVPVWVRAVQPGRLQHNAGRLRQHARWLPYGPRWLRSRYSPRWLPHGLRWLRYGPGRLRCGSGRLLRDDTGMSTVEYAIGTIAAAAFAALLYSVVTGDSIMSALTSLVQRALSITF